MPNMVKKYISSASYKKAIELCSRDKGATGTEIAKALHITSSTNAVTYLKDVLKHEYELRSELMPLERKRKLKLRGPVRVYFLQEKTMAKKKKPTVKKVTTEKEPVTQVEPSNVAPSQIGQQGVVGVGKPEATEEGTAEEAAGEVKSPNPEEPNPQVPADPGKPAVDSEGHPVAEENEQEPEPAQES